MKGRWGCWGRHQTWQACYWGWEQSITALRHGNLGRWFVPEAQCGSACDPIGQVGNELTDASFHASFKLVLIVVSPARSKQKHFLTWTWIWLVISYLKCCWEFWLKAAYWTYPSHATLFQTLLKAELLLLFTHSVMSDSLWPHGLQNAKLPCPSPSPGACSMSIESVMPSNHLILCHPLLLTSIFPSISVFSNELALCIRWPKYWSFNFSISPSSEYSGLISFRIDWFDLLAVQGTLKSLL